jgi:hypothetical protein
MLGHHLAGVGGISCLIIDFCPFPALQKKKAMLGRHLLGEVDISCLIINLFHFQGCRKRKPCLDAILLEWAASAVFCSWQPSLSPRDAQRSFFPYVGLQFLSLTFSL